MTAESSMSPTPRDDSRRRRRRRRRDPVATDEFRLADCADDDLGAADDFRKIFGAGVADGDGGVGGEQHHGHGAAEDGAASDDNGFAAFDGDLIAAEKTHDAGGCGGAVGGLVHGHAAEAVGGDAVDVFSRERCGRSRRARRSVWDGMLEEDAGGRGVGVEVVDGARSSAVVVALGSVMLRDSMPTRRQALAFHTDVGGGGGVVADEDGGEDGRVLQVERATRVASSASSSFAYALPSRTIAAWR